MPNKRERGGRKRHISPRYASAEAESGAPCSKAKKANKLVRWKWVCFKPQYFSKGWLETLGGVSSQNEMFKHAKKIWFHWLFCQGGSKSPIRMDCPLKDDNILVLNGLVDTTTE
jgi:hypothetical protein